MLKQRILTALVLLALFLPALFAQDVRPFMALTLLLVAAGAWEWSRLILPGRRGLAWLSPLLLLALGGAAWQAGWTTEAPAWLWTATGALWVLGAVWTVGRGVSGWSLASPSLRWALGLLLLAVAWVAMAAARTRGINFLLSCLVLVWAADVVAYFAGRALGRRWITRGLAPAISPNKSWEGALGGLLGVWAVAALWVQIDRWFLVDSVSLFTRLAGPGLWLAVPALAFMTAMSVLGDLVESLVKRSAGVKDSSGLLPGHGGVLDRLDALLPTLPLAMMLVGALRG